MNWTIFVVFFFVFVGYVVSERRYGNPDEWGDNFDGDILLPTTSRGLFRGDYFLWPDGTVPFLFASNFSKERIHDVLFGFDIFNFVTKGCLDFVVRGDEPDYLLFQDDGKTCLSYIGRERDAQPVFLAENCFIPFGVILHEILHALGFEHEHSRSDRDEYIKINWENLKPGSKKNFGKRFYNRAFEFQYPYDYDSIMHYSSYAYSHNGEKTIETTDPAYADHIGQRIRLSDQDKLELNEMYSCPF